MYNEYKGYVQSRGYKGAKLEQEITCATTKNYDHAQNKNLVDSDILTKDDFTVSITRDDTTGAITTATVSMLAAFSLMKAMLFTAMHHGLIM